MSVSTIDRPVSALRQRMLDDMAMRGLRSDTQRDYIRIVRSFAAFLGRSPDTATAEDIRRFQVHQHVNSLAIIGREMECAPAGGQFEVFDLTPLTGLLENRSRGQASNPQCRI